MSDPKTFEKDGVQIYAGQMGVEKNPATVSKMLGYLLDLAKEDIESLKFVCSNANFKTVGVEIKIIGAVARKEPMINLDEAGERKTVTVSSLSNGVYRAHHDKGFFFIQILGGSWCRFGSDKYRDVEEFARAGINRLVLIEEYNRGYNG